MKNKFGFIPIVLPVLVMVLIIGLINLTGPQTTQAQEMMNDREARLKSLTLKYAQEGESDAASASISVPLTQGSGSEGFLSGVDDYKAMVDNAVTIVDVIGTHSNPGTNQGQYAITYTGVGPDGNAVTPTGGTNGGGLTALAQGKTTITIVATEQGTFTAPDVPKMATYTIELTKKALEFEGDSPRLSALTVTYEGPPANTGGVDFFRKGYGGGQIAFNPGIKGYVATVPYTAQRFTINATPIETSTLATAGGTGAGDAVMISGDTDNDLTDESDSAETSTVTLGAGGKYSGTITVTGQGASVEYTLEVTRRYPELLGGTTPANNLTVATPSTGDTDKTFTQAELMAKSGTADLEATVPYEADVVTITGATCTDGSCVLSGAENSGGNVLGAQYRSTSTIVSPQDAVTDDTVNNTGIGHQVKLTSGATTTVAIQVRHWLPTLTPSPTDGSDPVSGQDAPDRGREVTTRYNLKIGRAAPVLADLTDDPATAGIHVLANDGLTGANLIRAADGTSAPAGAPSASAPYEINVPYDVDRVTLRTAVGPVPESGDDPISVTYSPGDAKGSVLGHQVYLNDAGEKTTIKITARSKMSPTKGLTTYTVVVTRAETMLDDLDICGNAIACGGPGDILLVPSGTTTPLASDGGDGDGFISTTTEYTATTSYVTTHVAVETDPGEGATEPRLVARTTQKAATTQPFTSTLVVGDNEIGIDVGIKSSSVRPNTTSYMVTVKRMAPQPTLRLTLLDKDGNLLGRASHQFKLDAQSRTYNFVDLTSDTFSRDDFLLLNSMRIATGDLGDGGVTPSLVRVSVNDGVTVRQLPGGSNELTLPGLTDSVVRIEFEVRYKTGDGNNEDASTHIILIRRPDDSRPVFPANHPLRDREIVLLVGERFSPNGINPPVELPFATGGNGDLSYVLEGDESKGTPRIPANITYDAPVGRATNGQLTGTPSILDFSDGASHHLILKVSDSDGITAASDEDTLSFSLRFVRDRSQITPSDVKKPDPGELFDINVLYAPYDHTGAKDTSAKLKPEFDPDVGAYVATVPTDVDEVDIHALASSSASVSLNSTVSNDKQTNVTRKFGTGTLHKWQGHKVLAGSAVNRYTFVTTEGTASETYILDIAREANTRPTFETDLKQTVKLFEDIELGDTGDIPAIKLPVAIDKSGNAASTTWMYSMKRRLSTAPNQDNDYLGLVFGGGTNAAVPVSSSMPDKKPPTLTGTPSLDTQDPSDSRLADRSEVYMRYTVQDQDKDTSAGDTDTLDYDVLVYRNVALMSYAVNGDTVGDLGDDSRMYKDGLTYSHEDIDTYTYNGVAHDATMATISATAWDSADASVSYSPADADTDTAGHQVNLTRGPNPVTVTVTNGAISAQHVINIGRPGLQAESISVVEFEDARSNAELSNAVKLDPKFDRNVTMYTAEVETWVQSVRVSATPVDPNAGVSVNAFAIPDPPGYSVVNLPTIGAANTITVGVSLANVESATYTIELTRKADTAPAFAEQQEDLTRTVDRALRNAITLPKAAGGNGDLTYSVNDEELPPGLRFDAATRTINGTPTLDEGYSADFEITYTVMDEDGNTAASDSDSQTFTITVTHDDVSETGPQEPAVDPAERNRLRDLVVTYDQGNVQGKVASLTPAFASDDSGPYTVKIPHDATNVRVEPRPASTEAVIVINNTRIAQGTKLVLPPTAVIEVSHAQVQGTMTYTLTTDRTDDSVPTFGDATIADMMFESGNAIDAVTLPMADLGDGNVVHSLRDHEGRLPEGLAFNASTRELTGTPVLLRDAVKTVYQMTYMATDENDDEAKLTFMITVCEAGSVGCEATPSEPTPTMTVTLTEWRSNDGTSATITWTPDSGAMNQAAFMVAANAGVTAPSSMDDLDGSTYTLLDASGAATVDDYLIPADTYMLEVTGLTAGTTYVYGVISWDGSAWGAWELVNFGQ